MKGHYSPLCLPAGAPLRTRLHKHTHPHVHQVDNYGRLCEQMKTIGYCSEMFEQTGSAMAYSPAHLQGHCKKSPEGRTKLADAVHEVMSPAVCPRHKPPCWPK